MLTETIIQTIRHAHTDYNSEKRYAGSIDIPLSEKGKEDCCKAASQLKKYQFDVVITSTMKRSIETAEILVDNKIPLVRSSMCNERNFGIMEGCTWDDILTFDPPILLIEVGNDLHTVNPKGGEAFEDVWERSKKFRSFIFKNFKGRSILVVSHGVFLQMFHGLLRGISCIESLGYYPSNLELARFCYKGNRLVDQKVEKLLKQGTDVRF